MKRVIGFALLILFFVAVFAWLVDLLVSSGIELKVAVFIALGTFVTAVLWLVFINFIDWLLD